MDDGYSVTVRGVINCTKIELNDAVIYYSAAMVGGWGWQTKQH